MKSTILHRNEKEIVRVLIKEPRALTPNEVADYSGMSWMTARKYLTSCSKKKLVKKEMHNDRERFRIHPDLLEALAKRRRVIR